MPNVVAREAYYAPIIRAAWDAEGMPWCWGMALAKIQSSFFADASRAMPAPERRTATSTAWGLCAVPLKLARELGYTGRGEALCDAELNARTAAQLWKHLGRGPAHGQCLEAASYYHCGRAMAYAPEPTAAVFLPRLAAVAEAMAVRYGAAHVSRLCPQPAPPLTPAGRPG